MPIEFKKEGNVCEKCHKSDTEVGKIVDYTDSHNGYRGLLCSNCIERREKPYKEICPKCNRLAYKHGGLTYFDESDLDDSDVIEIVDESKDFDDFYDLSKEKPPSFEDPMCLECHEKKVVKVKKNRKIKREIKNFAKDHWKFWIMLTIGILGLVFGLSQI